MALNIAAMQQPVNLVDQFLEGRALRQAEQMRAQQMTALQNAEGRAAAEEGRQQSRFNWDEAANKVKLDQIQAQKIKAGVDQVLAVPKGQRKAFVEKNFPDLPAKLVEGGMDWENTDEDDVEELARGLSAQSAAALGQSPKRPEAQSEPGRVAADVENKYLTSTQGDAILNAEKFTSPEAGVFDGKEVIYQVGEKTGKPRVVPGVSPRSQPGKPDTGFDRANVLRDEYNTQTKDFRIVGDAYQRLQSVAADPSAAGDLALIFSYMKILDPGSVVREQEFANAQNAAGIPDRIRNAYNRALTGERLPPSQRADFLKQAENLYKGQEKRQINVRKRYEKLARDFEIDPKVVIGSDNDDKGEEQPPNRPSLSDIFGGQ